MSVRAPRLAWVALSALAATAAGCNRAPAPAPSAKAAPTTAAASATAAPAPDGIAPLARRKTPSELRTADEAACTAGQLEACRKMADRHRGYGAAAGCGLDRGRTAPSIKRIPEDTEADVSAALRYLQRACNLGDQEACALERFAERPPLMSTAAAEDARIKSAVSGSALWRWAREARPQHVALLDAARKRCLDEGTSWGCSELEGQLYRRDAKQQKPLDAKVRERAMAICRDTLECSDVLMMLDKELYPLEEVRPVRAEMGKVLAEACLDGGCTCGEAARLLPDHDPQRASLAKAGCDNGEAEGCFELGALHEEGRGVPKDEARAFALYELTCPSMRPKEMEPGPRQGEYSPRACDRIAARHERGEMPPKERRHAFWFAKAACQRPGYERDHAPCLRLARYHGHDVDTGRNTEDAHIASLGPDRHPINRKECTRPSVAPACAELEKEIQGVRR